MAKVRKTKPVLHSFSQLQEVYFTYIKKKEDRDQIEKAYEYAAAHHEGQFRKSGEPYIYHLIEVAYIVSELQGGPSTIIAALLHDTVEDTDATVEEIRDLFGDDVAAIVDSLTKIQRLKLSRRKDDSDFVYEDHRKIFLGMARDIRVIIIKLADRLHNMRTLSYLSEDRQLVIARETLEVFVPIASRLGLNNIKSELEDLSLKYLNPDAYYEIVRLLKEKSPNLRKSLTEVSKRIADIIFKNNIPFEMKFRVKSVYSIYKKMHDKGYDFDHIYDVMALRIITETELNCYEILGIIHATYKPVMGRFKDYIAVPKSNMYQSLHTTIFSGSGEALEVQIRTKEMDKVAETGVAAHWSYKEGTNYNPHKEQLEIEEKLHWFRDFVGVSRDLGEDAKEYVDTITKEIFDKTVYAFTPKGKVIELPQGATPIDFAYKIHTGVGDSCIGALINGNLVPLATKIKTGDIVEIKTSKTSPGPNEGWLNIAVTNTAKSSIRKFLQKKNALLTRDEDIAQGKEILFDALKECGLTAEEAQEKVNVPALLKNFNVDSLDQLYLLVNSRNIPSSQIINYLKLKRVYKRKNVFKDKEELTSDNKTPVIVEGAGKVAVTLGNCCTPIPGDEIVGYITKGKGITIHRTSCPNAKRSPERLVEVKWNQNAPDNIYPVDIAINAVDREQLLVDVMNSFSQYKVATSQIKAAFHPTTRTTTINATIMVKNLAQLQTVFTMLGNVPSVYKVTRVNH
jgi:GTP pyrophosphokinase